MIAIEPTTDETYIKSVLLNPSIYAQMKDDSCPDEPSMLSPVDIKAIPGFFLRVIMDGISVGCFWLIWKGKSVEAHTALLEPCRGRFAIDATRKAIAWVFGNTKATAITSYAWSDSPLARWLCRKVGMTETVTAPWPSTRNGQIVNITYFQLTREAYS